MAPFLFTHDRDNGWFARLARLLGGAARSSRGRVALVGAGPGAADLLTVRAVRLLQDADVVLHDALVGPDVLDLIPRETEVVSVGKRRGAHRMTQCDIEALMLRHARAGRRVVRLKAGDPLVFGRAGEEMAALEAAGIDYEIVPGVTAALAAAADARLPLTLRGVASTLVLATAEGEGGSDPEHWETLAVAGTTVALYMGRSAGRRIRDRLVAAGLPASTPVVAVENAGRDGRRILSGVLDDLPALADRADVGGPTLIVIGPAAGLAATADAWPLAPLATAA
jgi:uroporphyrin-III C-methyltransferase/precorrin-2 dehydrogenase/sirohydrochlorin ferrochelatase